MQISTPSSREKPQKTSDGLGNLRVDETNVDRCPGGCPGTRSLHLIPGLISEGWMLVKIAMYDNFNSYNGHNDYDKLPLLNKLAKIWFFKKTLVGWR